MNIGRIEIHKELFSEQEKEILFFEDIKVTTFRYPNGIEAVKLTNNRGYLTILPFYGQMVWDAVFDNVDLKMVNMFSYPRYAENIAGTYGCFAFHSGILNNGCPGKEDTHKLHGEFSCAEMDKAYLEFSIDNQSSWVKLKSEYEYVMGFGSHYLATPEILIRPDSGSFEINMKVKNLSKQPMTLMYMCHINYAFAENGTIIQPTSFSAENIKVRTEIPGHVKATPEYIDFINELSKNPASHEKLVNADKYNPEQVFYLYNLKDKVTHYLKRESNDSFFISYDANKFTHAVRWLLYNSDQKVAAFALPSTCEPEGYHSELKKGNVQTLEGEQMVEFNVTLGYLNKKETKESLNKQGGNNVK